MYAEKRLRKEDKKRVEEIRKLREYIARKRKKNF